MGSWLEEYEPCTTIKVNTKLVPQARRCDFALRIRGNSMEPYYYDGDTVFIKEQPMVDNGQIGIFIFEGEAYIKKLLIEDGKMFLISLNEKYEPIEITNDSFKCVGLVL